MPIGNFAGASPKDPADIGFINPYEVSDAELIKWITSAQTVNSAIGDANSLYQAGAIDDPNYSVDNYGWGSVAPASQIFPGSSYGGTGGWDSVGKVQGTNPISPELQAQLDILGSNPTFFGGQQGGDISAILQSKMGLESAAAAFGGGNAGGPWVNYGLARMPDWFYEQDPSQMNLTQARNAIADVANQYATSGNVGTFLNDFGPLALNFIGGQVVGGLANSIAGLPTGMGPLPTPTGYINIGGTPVVATTTGAGANGLFDWVGAGKAVLGGGGDDKDEPPIVKDKDTDTGGNVVVVEGPQPGNDPIDPTNPDSTPTNQDDDNGGNVFTGPVTGDTTDTEGTEGQGDQDGEGGGRNWVFTGSGQGGDGVEGSKGSEDLDEEKDEGFDPLIVTGGGNNMFDDDFDWGSFLEEIIPGVVSNVVSNISIDNSMEGMEDIAEALMEQSKFKPYDVEVEGFSKAVFDEETGKATGSLSDQAQGYANLFGDAGSKFMQQAMDFDEDVWAGDKLQAYNQNMERDDLLALRNLENTLFGGGMTGNSTGAYAGLNAFRDAQLQDKNNFFLNALMQAGNRQNQLFNMGNTGMNNYAAMMNQSLAPLELGANIGTMSASSNLAAGTPFMNAQMNTAMMNNMQNQDWIRDFLGPFMTG